MERKKGYSILRLFSVDVSLIQQQKPPDPPCKSAKTHYEESETKQ